MEVIMWLLIIQGILGAFDMFYHHEIKEKLPWRPTASKEMLLHGIRNFFYAVLFFSFGWIAWEGVYAWLFIGIIITEVLITLWDFVEEDRSRKLPATERVTHAILTLNYGAVIALFVPVLIEWSVRPTGFTRMDYGFLSWIMTLFSLGVFIWAIRDMLRAFKLYKNIDTDSVVFPKLLTPHQSVLVTGGTGFIGRRLCQYLINEGHDVIILTRHISKAAELFTGRVTFIEDLCHIRSDEKIDVIINLAGEKVAQRWNERSKKIIYNSRIQLIDQLYHLIVRLHHKPATFIQASAIGLYGLHETREFHEYDEPHTDNSFAQIICRDIEQKMPQFSDTGLRCCILRIGLVIEKDGGALRELLIPFDCGLGGPIGHGRQWWSWIHRDDVVGIILHLINKENAEGVYNVTAPEPVTHKQFAGALGRAMKRPAIFPMPAFMVKLLFGQMGNDVMLHGQKVLPTRTLQSGYRFAYPHLQQALNAIFKG